MKFYSRTLEATGGALCWEKCRAYLLLSLWINGVQTMLMTKTSHPPLKIDRYGTQTITEILLANLDEAFKTLGIFVDTDENDSTQRKVLQKKAKEWAGKVNRLYLTSHEALVVSMQVFSPALVYPLSVICLSEKECDDIMKPAIKALFLIFALVGIITIFYHFIT